MSEPTTTTRFLFDSIESAAEGLLVTLLDARMTESTYSFGYLSAKQVYMSGLVLTGRISEVVAKLENVSGAVRHDE